MGISSKNSKFIRSASAMALSASIAVGVGGLTASANTVEDANLHQAQKAFDATNVVDNGTSQVDNNQNGITVDYNNNVQENQKTSTKLKALGVDSNGVQNIKAVADGVTTITLDKMGDLAYVDMMGILPSTMSISTVTISPIFSTGEPKSFEYGVTEDNKLSVLKTKNTNELSSLMIVVSGTDEVTGLDQAYTSYVYIINSDMTTVLDKEKDNNIKTGELGSANKTGEIPNGVAYIGDTPYIIDTLATYNSDKYTFQLADFKKDSAKFSDSITKLNYEGSSIPGDAVEGNKLGKQEEIASTNNVRLVKLSDGIYSFEGTARGVTNVRVYDDKGAVVQDFKIYIEDGKKTEGKENNEDDNTNGKPSIEDGTNDDIVDVEDESGSGEKQTEEGDTETDGGNKEEGDTEDGVGDPEPIVDTEDTEDIDVGNLDDEDSDPEPSTDDDVAIGDADDVDDIETVTDDTEDTEDTPEVGTEDTTSDDEEELPQTGEGTNGIAVGVGLGALLGGLFMGIKGRLRKKKALKAEKEKKED